MIRFFENPSSKKNYPFEFRFFGKKYKGNLSNLIDWSAFFYGFYAYEELQCADDFLEKRAESVVVDVGANIGHHALFFSTISKHVYAFEPFNLVSEKLEEKVTLNNLKNVTLYKYGLGNTNGHLDYYPPITANSGTGSFVKSDGWWNASAPIKLNIVCGDDFFSSVGIKKIDYIKIDVEHFEVQVLQGMQNSLSKFRPVCFIEWNQEGKNEINNGSNLFPERYLFFRLIGSEPFCLFFSKIGYDLQLLKDSWSNGNILAVPEEIAKSITLKNCRSKLLKEP